MGPGVRRDDTEYCAASRAHTRHYSRFRFASARASLLNTDKKTELGEGNRMVSLFSRVALLALVYATSIVSALAQTPAYPTRTITLVLPFAAGSGTDTTTRI